MRDLGETRELATPQLVEDLAWLFLGVLVDLLALMRGEEPERPLGDIGVPAERLIRGDETVAPERDRIPGNARGREWAAGVEFEERAHVERAARDESLVEGLGARRVSRARPQEPSVARVERVDRVVEAVGRRGGAGAVLARDHRELELEELLWPERARHAKAISLDGVGRRAERDFRGPTNAVAAETFEHDATLARSQL